MRDKWTAEVEYQSAEAKQTTGYVHIRNSYGDHVCKVKQPYAEIIRAAPQILALLRRAVAAHAMSHGSAVTPQWVIEARELLEVQP